MNDAFLTNERVIHEKSQLRINYLTFKVVLKPINNQLMIFRPQVISILAGDEELFFYIYAFCFPVYFGTYQMKMTRYSSFQYKFHLNSFKNDKISLS